MGELLVATLFIYVPQLILIVYAALSVQRQHTPLRKVVAGGVYAAAALAVFRALPFPMGTHTVLSAIFIVVLFRYLSRGPWPVLILGVLFAYILSFLGEWLLALPLLTLLGISVEDGLADIRLMMLFSWVSNVPLLLWCGIHYYRHQLERREAGVEPAGLAAIDGGRPRFTWLAIGALTVAWLGALVSLVRYAGQEGFPPQAAAPLFDAYQPIILAGVLALALSVGAVLLYTWGLDEQARQRRLEQRFEKVFQATPAAMMIVSAETGSFIDVNDRFLELTGLDRDEAIGANSLEVAGSYLVESEVDLTSLPEAELPLQGIEVTYRSHAGELGLVLVSAEPVEIEGEDCILVTASDITERKQMEETLQKQRDAEARERAMGRFLSIAAHELRNPMASLKGLCYLLRTRRDEPVEARLRRVTIMEQQIDHLSALLNDILEASRVQEQELRVKQQIIPLTSVVHEVLETFRAAVSEHAFTVSGVAHNGPIWVVGDRRWLREVMENLLSNAVKYAPDGTEIRITCQQVEMKEVILSVEDEGPGIPEDELEDIFEGFYRVQSERDPGGMGLGLYIARKVVEAHGGTITAENRPTGGAAIRVRLPMHVFEDRLAESPESSTPPQRPA